MKARLIALAVAVAVGVVLWLPLTSIALCFALKTSWTVDWQVLPFAAFFYWRDYGAAPLVAYWLPMCAIGAAMVATMPAVLVMGWPESRRLQLAREGEKIAAPRRARSDAHGSAEWMSIEEAAKIFSGPHPEYGGVVVGEAYRVDRDKTAAQRFNADDPETWGRGGKAPLLIDPCTSDATHGAIVAGTGGFKTTAVTIPTLAYWTGSVVVHDPSGQVGPMTTPMRRQMGHKVVTVGPELDRNGNAVRWTGFNVLAWIDPRDPLAETHVQAVVEQIAGETRDDDKNAMFKISAKELLTCILANMIWDEMLPAERRTLREFRERVRTPERKMKGLLADIQINSKSALARDLAGSLVETFSETFSGIHRNANADSQWLSIAAYADMVSGGPFQPAELLGGNLSVFVQIPMETLRSTPAVARVVMGALLGAVYRANGAIAGRALFLLDEVHFLGRLKALEDARDAGRKYGITLVMMWQSLGQIVETWKEHGKTAWLSSCSWQMFAAVNDGATAAEVSKSAGRYTILARSQSMSTGAQSGGQSNSRNESISEQPHDLISPDKVRTMRADEAILFTRGAPPARLGRAIYFRRADLQALIKADRFRKAA